MSSFDVNLTRQDGLVSAALFLYIYMLNFPHFFHLDTHQHTQKNTFLTSLRTKKKNILSHFATHISTKKMYFFYFSHTHQHILF